MLVFCVLRHGGVEVSINAAFITITKDSITKDTYFRMP